MIYKNSKKKSRRAGLILLVMAVAIASVVTYIPAFGGQTEGNAPFEVNEASYEWVLEPFLEADDLFYTQMCPGADSLRSETGISINECYQQQMYPHIVALKDGYYGILHKDGSLQNGDFFCTSVISVGPYDPSNTDGYPDVLYELKLKEPMGITLGPGAPTLSADWVVMYDDGTFSLAEHGSPAGYYGYYYNNGLQLAVSSEGNFDFWFNPGNGEKDSKIMQLMFRLDKAIPVYTAYDYFSGISVYNNASGVNESWWKYHANDKYAIWYDYQLQTDFIYEACGTESCGLLAVCQDGKWGYAGSHGNIVIPIEYDASWHSYCDYNMFYGDSFTRDPALGFAYAATEGYVVLHKGEDWELCNIEGEKPVISIPAGVFEQITPVYEGECWVKQNGLWGLIRITEA